MEIAIVGLLILINGFFALSEIALVSSRKNRLEEMRLKGSKGAKIALHLMDDSERFLSAIQVGITLIGTANGAFGGTSIANMITPELAQIPIIGDFASQIALFITISIITYVSIVIGELVPKTVALSNPEKLAVLVAPSINVFSIIAFPLVKLLSVSTNVVNTILQIRKPDESLTKAELRALMKHASVSGVIQTHQYNYHEKLFHFEGKKAKHLMTHRTEVEMIDLNLPAEKNHEKIKGMQHVRIVCCRGNQDTIEGILDLTDYYHELIHSGTCDINKLITEPVFVVESTDAERIIQLFRSEKTQFCIVLNQYGGFEGVISLHDVIEGIIGEMPNEGDTDLPDITIQEDKSVLVNGDAPVELLDQIIDGIVFDFEELNFSTVAGFVLAHLTEIPEIGAHFEYLNYRIEVVNLDDNRIDKVMIRECTPEESEG